MAKYSQVLKIVFWFWFLFIGSEIKVFAQNYNSQKRATVYATHFPESKAKINKFIRQHSIRIQKKEEMAERISAEFVMPENNLAALDSLIPSLGWVVENALTSQDFQQHIRQIKINLQDEAEEQNRLQEQLRQAALEAAQKQQLQSRLENSLHNRKRLQQELRNYEDYDSLVFVAINIYDEITYPTGNRKIAFVNMPGIEYSLLFPENPKTGTSNDLYQGYLIKYLFTRGKSYLDLGVYKAVDNNRADSTLINELFLINFGQDFYPRHFGRGKRKYLNLYTCYQIGGFIINRNNDKHNTFNPNLNIGLGVEIFKSKHILIDNKVSYFLPLNELNRNLRSLSYNASLNFVF
ncbi:hypothetical protein [Adhaeribacter terreus]|uniref:Outer membrane beta-barrel protein n=1 Tax=Adhaeribacter terreus TaxID=529703 RepID=A0ABW0E6P7_9BACT